MLKITNLTKRYGDNITDAVKNLNLELKKGEVFGFLGPNGSGKSTTIKCVVGILPYNEGEIEIDGINIKTQPIQAKNIIGYVPDNHAVFERLTGREYVNHIGNLYNVTISDMQDRCNKYLKLLQLEEAFDKPIMSYSHGMKQKISVIASLIHNPKLWILDEPLMGLDPQSAYQLKLAMKKHAQEGNTVFFSSHILDVVENLCDRACIIKKGGLVGIYDISELKNNKQSLEKLFMEVIYNENFEGTNIKGNNFNGADI
jgi:ABC-2 type transport system ATP-binding protein